METQSMNDETAESRPPNFDQLLVMHNGNLDDVDVAPSTVYPAEIVFEPMPVGSQAKRLTVRTLDHQVLTAFIASAGHLSMSKASVALYTGIKDLIRDELLDKVAIPPGTVYPAEVVFEPIYTRSKRLTVRTPDHQALTAIIATDELLSKPTAEADLYTGIKGLIRDELSDTPSSKEMSSAEADSIITDFEQKTIPWLRRSITVKKESPESRKRAYAIACMIKDIETLIENQTASLHMKSKTDTETTP